MWYQHSKEEAHGPFWRESKRLSAVRGSLEGLMPSSELLNLSERQSLLCEAGDYDSANASFEGPWGLNEIMCEKPGQCSVCVAGSSSEVMLGAIKLETNFRQLRQWSDLVLRNTFDKSEFCRSLLGGNLSVDVCFAS